MQFEILDKMRHGYVPNKKELVSLLEGEADEYLFKYANEVCLERKGKIVDIRAILEFSNYCACKCIYCGLNVHNSNVSRYRMDKDSIIKTALLASEAGYKTIVLQSGEDYSYTKDMMCEIVESIKKQSDISITLSIGERSFDELQAMRNAGADRFLLKHETSDEKLYEILHKEDGLKDRIACQKNIKLLKYETGGGFMIGIPGQSTSTIAEDILLLKEVGIDMAGIGPFISHEDTPLKGSPNGSSIMTRRAVALTRLLIPDANLPATTSLGVLEPKERDLVFSCGANVIMRKVTPIEERLKYQIYPVNFGEIKDILTERKQLEDYIKSLDRIPV